MCSFSVQQSLGTKVCISMLIHIILHPKHKLNVEDSHAYCDVQDLSCSLGILSKKLAYEGPNNHKLSRSSGVKLKPNMTLATFHIGYDKQPSIPVLKQSCHKHLPKRHMILIWASLLIRLTYSHGKVDPIMITLTVSLWLCNHWPQLG